MSLFQILAAPLRRALRVILSLFMPRTVDIAPVVEPPVLPRLSTRVAGPRETS